MLRLVWNLTISIHSLLAEGDSDRRETAVPSADFNPLPPRGGRRSARPGCRSRPNFNPLPPRGGRHQRGRYKRERCDFNPLPPRGGRHARQTACERAPEFQSTPSSRRETPRSWLSRPRRRFQSTPSSRRETITLTDLQTGKCSNFNPLPPRGGRLMRAARRAMQQLISIHSLLAEGDPRSTARRIRTRGFQSTPSSRRETRAYTMLGDGDINFNPLPPRGGRHARYCCKEFKEAFQSTPSSRRETVLSSSPTRRRKFQSTPSSRRETFTTGAVKVAGDAFQSTPSSRRETSAYRV